MIRCLGAQADLFYFDLLLGFTGFTLPLGFLVEKLAIIHHFADWRLSVWRNLNQIQISLLRLVQCLTCRHDTKVMPICADQTHFPGADLPVDSVLFGANTSSLA